MTTDYLFAQPSFRSGVASLADLEGLVFYNYSDTPQVADSSALASDWSMVGSDLESALQNYEQ